MSKDKIENNLKAWREFREMTQEQLAEAIGTTASVISLIENGQRQLSLKWLQRLGPALSTTPGFILDHDPNDLPTEVLDIWGSIPEEAQQQALAVLKAFARKTG